MVNQFKGTCLNDAIKAHKPIIYETSDSKVFWE